MVSDNQVKEVLAPLLLKDLRIQCRARGLNPGGSRPALLDRVHEHMMATGNLSLVNESGGEVLPSESAPAAAVDVGAIGVKNNNYTRPEGQNCGNFVTDRSSSRVLAPPGGKTSFSFGSEPAPTLIAAKKAGQEPAESWAAPVDTPAEHPHASAEPANPAPFIGDGEGNNNYTRPQGQNTGNFLSGRPSSRVLAPPGGGSHITFG